MRLLEVPEPFGMTGEFRGGRCDGSGGGGGGGGGSGSDRDGGGLGAGTGGLAGRAAVSAAPDKNGTTATGRGRRDTSC